MNRDGKAREVKGPKKPLLPAWSETASALRGCRRPARAGSA